MHLYFLYDHAYKTLSRRCCSAMWHFLVSSFPQIKMVHMAWCSVLEKLCQPVPHFLTYYLAPLLTSYPAWSILPTSSGHCRVALTRSAICRPTCRAIPFSSFCAQTLSSLACYRAFLLLSHHRCLHSSGSVSAHYHCLPPLILLPTWSNAVSTHVKFEIVCNVYRVAWPACHNIAAIPRQSLMSLVMSPGPARHM